MLTKQISYDHSITELFQVQVRQITRIMENGKELSRIYHRHVICPGDDYSKEDEITKVIAKAIHTPDLVKEYGVNK